MKPINAHYNSSVLLFCAEGHETAGYTSEIYTCKTVSSCQVFFMFNIKIKKRIIPFALLLLSAEVSQLAVAESSGCVRIFYS